MNNKILTKKQIKSLYWDATSEVESLNTFGFNLIKYPKNAWIHVIVLGVVAGSISYYYAHTYYSYEKKEFTRSIPWEIDIIYIIQILIITRAYSRWAAVWIATNVELKIQNSGSRVYADDPARKILISAIISSKRFRINDFIFGVLICIVGLVIQKTIIIAIFFLTHL